MAAPDPVKGLASLPPLEIDALLQLIAMCNADPRPEKIDVGIGVYRDGDGRTPVLSVIKDAERILLETQASKSYLGMAGDKRFTELLRPILLGRHADDDRIAGLQTPGGCGALSLGFRLVARASPGARAIVGTPTWPNHLPIIRSAGLQLTEYDYYDRESHGVRFDALLAALCEADPGDVVLLQAGCHNPTGADLDDRQWAEVISVMNSRRLLPFVDIAYQGLAAGLDEDARGLHAVLDACEDVIVSQSCDKNFSVYRDRVGSLWVKTGSSNATGTAMAHVSQLAREIWSMPPDHGAAAVRVVLDTPELRQRWSVELAAIRDRITEVRNRIAATSPLLAYIGRQRGMYSMLPLSKEQILRLRQRNAIYMADTGRFNVVGMSDAEIDRFIAAILETLEG